MLKSKNPLTLWIIEFRTHQPEAKPLDGWRHLTQTAAAFGLLEWLTGFDPELQEVTYRRAPWLGEKRLGLESFRRQFHRAGLSA